MKGSTIVIGLAVLALVAGGAVWMNGGNGAPQVEGPALSPPSAAGDATPPPGTQAPAPNTVSYSSSGFSPGVLTVTKGTTVTFRNDSPFQMRPASAMHPSHAVYPAKGGCIGSTFDACTAIMPGGSWSFNFSETGSWKYHDHLSPAKTGAIVVQ